ncbi:hypothetical protein [Bacteroides fragilis]
MLTHAWPGNVRELRRKLWVLYCRRRKVLS